MKPKPSSDVISISSISPVTFKETETKLELPDYMKEIRKLWKLDGDDVDESPSVTNVNRDTTVTAADSFASLGGGEREDNGLRKFRKEPNSLGNAIANASVLSGISTDAPSTSYRSTNASSLMSLRSSSNIN